MARSTTARTACVLALLALSASAEAQSPVEIEINDGFGSQRNAFLIAEVRNKTREALRGVLEIEVSDWSTGASRYQMPADLPPRSVRTFQFEVPPAEGNLKAYFRVDGDVVGEWQRGSWGRGNSPVVVVLGERAQLRSVISSIEGTDVTEYGSARQIAYEASRISFDSAGDPIAPRTLAGWRGVKMVAATTRDLQRLDPEQRDALYQWVWTGGRMMLSQSAPEDQQSEAVQAFTGPVEEARASARYREETFGATLTIGFGLLWYVGRDLDTPAAATDPAVADMVGQMLELSTPSLTTPKAAFFQPERLHAYGGTELPFAGLRASLDPNESFRPALGFVAIVLFLYVFFVGPINFGYVHKKGRPTLALTTTPLIALACLAVMLLVGYIGKGISMRYRSVTWIETMSDSTLAQSRTYRGLFSTRPTSYDLPASGWLTMVSEQGSLTHELSPGSYGTITDVRSALWETIFVREEAMRDLGGAFSFEAGASAEGTLGAVRNGTTMALEDAVVLSPSGQVYIVGDLAPGQRMVVPTTPAFVLTGGYPGGMGVQEMQDALGFTADDDDMVSGLVELVQGWPSLGVVLYARIAQDPSPYSIFACEHSIGVIRVQLAAPPANQLVVSPDILLEAATRVQPEPGSEPPPGSLLNPGLPGQTGGDAGEDAGGVEAPEVEAAFPPGYDPAPPIGEGPL